MTARTADAHERTTGCTGGHHINWRVDVQVRNEAARAGCAAYLRTPVAVSTRTWLSRRIGVPPRAPKTIWARHAIGVAALTVTTRPDPGTPKDRDRAPFRGSRGPDHTIHCVACGWHGRRHGKGRGQARNDSRSTAEGSPDEYHDERQAMGCRTGRRCEVAALSGAVGNIIRGGIGR